MQSPCNPLKQPFGLLIECFDSVTPWFLCQVSLSMGYSGQEYYSGLSIPPPRDLPDPEIEPASLMFPVLAGKFFTTSATGKPTFHTKYICYKFNF